MKLLQIEFNCLAAMFLFTIHVVQFFSARCSDERVYARFIHMKFTFSPRETRGLCVDILILYQRATSSEIEKISDLDDLRH